MIFYFIYSSQAARTASSSFALIAMPGRRLAILLVFISSFFFRTSEK